MTATVKFILVDPIWGDQEEPLGEFSTMEIYRLFTLAQRQLSEIKARTGLSKVELDLQEKIAKIRRENPDKLF